MRKRKGIVEPKLNGKPRRERLDPNLADLAGLPDTEWWATVRKWPGLFSTTIKEIQRIQFDLLEKGYGKGQQFNALYCLRAAVVRVRRPRVRLKG
jgi:hypothetical protein